MVMQKDYNFLCQLDRHPFIVQRHQFFTATSHNACVNQYLLMEPKFAFSYQFTYLHFPSELSYGMRIFSSLSTYDFLCEQ